MSTTNTQLNWEIVLRTDEHIVQAISELIVRNLLMSFDEAFLGNLQSWYDKRGKLTPKQSQSAIKTLAKRYSKRLQAIYDDPNNGTFKAYIDATTEVMDEEFVEEVSDFVNINVCPICDHKLIVNSVSNTKITTDSLTIKCAKCHTTINFMKV
jgi:glutathionyl-hydroquinone reductase